MPIERDSPFSSNDSCGNQSGFSVLHVAETVAGGPASHLCEIWGYQVAKLGHRNLSFLVPNAQRTHLPKDAEDNIYGFPGRDRSLYRMLALATNFVRLCLRLKPDVIHFHSTFAALIGRPIALCLCRKAAVVYTPHGWSFLREGHAYARRFYASVEKLLAPLAGKIICVSNEEFAAGVAAGIKADRLVAIKNGIRSPGVQKVWKANRSSEPITCLFIGRFDRQKGIDYLHGVFENHADLVEGVRFELIGDAVVSSAEFSRRPVTSVDVTYCGWISREEVLQKLAEADVLVMPSRWEGLPITAIEALSIGVPIVGSDIAPLREVIDEGRTGYIWHRAEGTKALASILGSLSLSDLEKRGAECREAFTKHFQAEKMNQQILNTYRGLLGY